MNDKDWTIDRENNLIRHRNGVEIEFQHCRNGSCEIINISNYPKDFNMRGFSRFLREAELQYNLAREKPKIKKTTKRPVLKLKPKNSVPVL